MDFATLNNVNEVYTVMISLWRAFLFISLTWCSSAIIIEIVKIYTFRGDKKELVKAMFNILKTLVYFIPIGIMIPIASGIYNDSLNLNILFVATLVGTTTISILISYLYKIYFKTSPAKINNEIEDCNKNQDI